MEQMLDLGMIFQDGRRVKNKRVGIMTSSGGAGVLLADACANQGLSVPIIPEDEQKAMLGFVPQPFYGSLTNPVDTTAQVVNSPGAFSAVLNAVINSRVVDMLCPVTWAYPGAQTDALIEMYKGSDKPVALTSTAWMKEFQEAGLPTYTDPHRAAAALAAVAHQSLRTVDYSARTSFKASAARVKKARKLLEPAAGNRSLLESTSKE